MKHLLCLKFCTFAFQIFRTSQASETILLKLTMVIKMKPWVSFFFLQNYCHYYSINFKARCLLYGLFSLFFSARHRPKRPVRPDGCGGPGWPLRLRWRGPPGTAHRPPHLLQPPHRPGSDQGRGRSLCLPHRKVYCYTALRIGTRFALGRPIPLPARLVRHCAALEQRICQN